MEIVGNQKKHQKFYCEKCDFTCSRQKELERHQLTPKHNFSHNWKSLEITKNTRRQKLKCECGQIYETHSGLWKHKKKCDKHQEPKKCDTENNTPANTVTKIDILNNNQNTDNAYLTQLFLDSIKQNQDFQQQMFELLKDNIGGNNNNTINSHNKTMNNNFNLNLFLNETCKDAMDIDDFIDYVKVKMDDFENFGRVGYPRAVGDIIVRNLNELDVRIRPIHCSDVKREVLHIKHDGVWHIDETQKFMKKSIMYVANKNIKQIPKWQELNPESRDCFTKTFEKYNNLCRASLGAATDEEEADFLKKITSIVAKGVVIDKKKKY